MGKDECASVLVKKFGAVQTGLADPAKRHMADLYGFTEDQLFGPSTSRNAGDLRYPKDFLAGLDFAHTDSSWTLRIQSEAASTMKLEADLVRWHHANDPKLPPVGMERDGKDVVFTGRSGDPRLWLSPRESLQLYCELMNTLYLDTWVKKGIDVHRQLGEVHAGDDEDVFMRYEYDRMKGVIRNEHGGNWRKNVGHFISCFADFRHWHEIRAARRVTDMVPVLVRVKSKRVPSPPYQHRSETEQATIPDSEFDFVLQNDGSVEEAHAKVERMMDSVLGRAVRL